MALTFLASALVAHGALGVPPQVLPLAPKAYRTWSITLPANPFRTVSGAIPIPHANGSGFAVESRGVGLALDTDGDGELDRTLEGREHPETKVREARVALSGTTASGQPFRYPVRLEDAGSGWRWAPGGAMVGELDGTTLEVIDLDGNGSFGDVGRDAIVVGGTGVAQLLGETLSIGGALRTVAVAADGSQLTLGAFEGDAGVLDLHSRLDAKGVLLAAVVRSVDGRHSFELSLHEDGLTVPAGAYRLVKAELGLGEARVVVDPAGMKPLEVAAGERTALEWGGPVCASFSVQRNGQEIVLSPNDVQFLGAAGELWVGWQPIGKSPTFTIKEKRTGDVLIDVVFPGSC